MCMRKIELPQSAYTGETILYEINSMLAYNPILSLSDLEICVSREYFEYLISKAKEYGIKYTYGRSGGIYRATLYKVDVIFDEDVLFDNMIIRTKIHRSVNDRLHIPYFEPYTFKDKSWSVLNLNIKKVIFNDPATVVIWGDGTKTIVRTQKKETFDPEKGLAMAICKKALGNKGNYYDIFRKHIDDYFASCFASCMNKPDNDKHKQQVDRGIRTIKVEEV